nr:recombinase family protein [uncultured Pseudodesulfovibrio sp.]
MPDIPVVEFLRVSTAEQAEEGRAGLARQQAACGAAIERHGLVVVDRVELVDVSGTCAADTPEMTALLALLRAGRAKGLVVADFDRLLRADDFRSFGLLQDIQDTGAQIYMPDQVVDLASQAGFLMGGIQSLMAGNERRQILKRSSEAKEAMRRRGECPSGPQTLPLGVGYDKASRSWSYSDEAQLVVDAFRMYAGGVHNFTEIGRRLGLSRERVARLLVNEIYIGFRVYDEYKRGERYERQDGRQAERRKMARAPQDVIRVKVFDEPLIDEALFWSVRDHILNRKNFFRARQSGVADRYLFAGMVRCGYCGHPMYTGGRADRQRGPGHYKCRVHTSYGDVHGLCCESPNRYSKAVVERLLLRFIQGQLASEEYLLAQLDGLRLRDGLEERRRELARLTVRVEQAAAKKKRVLGLYVDGRFGKADLDAKSEEAQREIDAVEARIRVVQREIEQVDHTGQEDALRNMAAAFCEFPFWSREEQRELLEALRPEFYITAEGVVRFALPMEMEVEPAFRFVEDATMDDLGLEAGGVYTSTILSRAFGETLSGFGKKVQMGIYIDAARKVGSKRYYTEAEALENYRRFRAHRMGLPVDRSEGNHG